MSAWDDGFAPKRGAVPDGYERWGKTTQERNGKPPMNTTEGMALDPCPFCGGEAEFERVGTPRQSCIVACRNCGARHESSDENERSGSSWNSRAAAAPTPPEQPGESVCATCGGLVSDPVIAQPAAQGELTFCQMCGEGVVPGLCRSKVGQCANAARKRPAAQCEGYLSGVNVEALLRACAELGLSAESSLEALAAPDVLAEHINRVSRAVIAAARKESDHE